MPQSHETSNAVMSKAQPAGDCPAAAPAGLAGFLASDTATNTGSATVIPQGQVNVSIDDNGNASARKSYDAAVALVRKDRNAFNATHVSATAIRALAATAAAKKSAAHSKERKDLQTSASTNPALAAFATVEAAQDEWEDVLRALAHSRGRSLRLDKFVTIVKAASIIPFTTYARENWPYKPQEFYAEAYSLWLTDPEFLKKEYAPVFNFFDSGDYEK